MRTQTKVAALALAIVATPIAAHSYNVFTAPSGDELKDRIIELGYLPNNPPVNFMTVGSLYYIDSKLKHFFPICKATLQDIKDIHNTSFSEDFTKRLQRRGDLATSISFDIGASIHGNAENSFVGNVAYSLTDVQIDEIELGPNWGVFDMLMDRPYCRKAAFSLVNDGWVCQVVNILSASSEFRLDRTTRTKLEASAEGVPSSVKSVMKHAIETQSDQGVVEKEGRLISGKALQYGVILTPQCLVPPGGRFKRVLHPSAVGQYWNYFLFHIVEPMLGSGSDTSNKDSPADTERSDQVATKQSATPH